MGVQFRDYEMQLKKDVEKLPPVDLITKSLEEMLNFSKQQSQFRKGDKIDLGVSNPQFGHRYISTGYRKEDDHIDALKEKLMQILTSDGTVDLFKCTFNVHTITMPHGGARTRIVNLAKDLHTKKSVVEIRNNDNLCGPRAIIVGLTYYQNNILGRQLESSHIKTIRMGRLIQKELAEELCRHIGYNLEDTETGFTLKDFKKVEEKLDIQITVLNADFNNSVCYRGDEKDVKIHLYKQGEHYDTITNMKAFFGSKNFCEKCLTSYAKKDKHITCVKGAKCYLCRDVKHDPESIRRVFCKDCNRYCMNEQCLNQHKSFVCKTWYKCKTCNELERHDNAENHKCGYAKCRNCKQIVEKATHKCYMTMTSAKGGKCEGGCQNCDPTSKIKNKKCTYTEKYIFFDYEAQQETGQHIPNLIIAHDFSGNVYSFNTNDDFCAWLISRKHKNYTAIAHYARGYDAHFILQYCLKQTILPKTIYNGSKLMELKIKTLKLRIIDSHCFVPSALSDFPKTFALTELHKGYFPHLFNTVENKNYIGKIPDKRFYCANRMKPDARKKFVDWHNARVAEGYQFDMQKELFAYCNSDVDILRRGCLQLRNDFLGIANIDPFCYITIASVCMATYRSMYLKPNTIAVLNKELSDQFSDISLMWLKSLSNSENIAYAGNGGEVSLCGVKVDGFDSDTNTVYQFHGCFWHGCPDCYNEETVNKVNNYSMGDLYQKAMDRTEQLRLAGFTVIEMWQCKWLKSTEYRNYKASNITQQITNPLNPRDAFFGGRTEVFKLKKAVDGVNEKINYIDVCSLYPTVMYYDDYPVGHPTKIYSPANHDPSWFGFIKCRILAPYDLIIPLLPVKVMMNKTEKLLFPLCLKCAIESQSRCEHSATERQFVGTWSTVEVNKAIEVGYQVNTTYSKRPER
ncbi:uncharacterized protein LOC135841092 [Planococcus citri]|uniref:uncharacterized protein LOC135841092 n=1 Tax=Planococcus citri TaxID=170843 RepID=UPI0031F72FD5